jgi:penicillin-binding protein 2
MFESRQRIIILIFILVCFTFLMRLFYMQVIDDSYKQAAANISLQRIIEYPYRGIIYDRKGKICVYNIPVYDVMVLPKEVKKNMDTLRFCRLFGIDKQEFIDKILAARTYSKVKPSAFIKQLSHTDFARIQDQLIDFPGFFISPRTVRGYDHKALGVVLGYIGEISAGKLEKLKKEGNHYYKSGDYLGIAGLESYYEEHLRGRRGIKFMMVDVNGIQKGHYKDGIYDTSAIRGENLYTSLDLELQKFGEELMVNKKGSIICIEPGTGEILAMISSPAYDPNLLTGREFSKNYLALQRDPLKPLFNRAMMAPYPPGSIFKTLQALTALQEGVIDSNMVWPCVQDVVHCHPHPSPCNLRQSIQWSCNPYYLQVYRRIINQKSSNNTFIDTRIGYDKWRDYMSGFGIGQKLGIDMPSEKKGILRTVAYYDRIYGEKHWKYSNIYSLSIGQGELGLSPLHMANMACVLANRGYYYTPHFVKRIGDKGKPITDFTTPHKTKIEPRHFEAVLTGMKWAVQQGTVWSQARMKTIEICGKTGTAQNPHGKDHSIFICFAPKDNPKIAVATVVENSGFGGFVAAPIASLMVEKYLNDTINRKNLYKHMLSRDYIHKDTSDTENGKAGKTGKNH